MFWYPGMASIFSSGGAVGAEGAASGFAFSGISPVYFGTSTPGGGAIYVINKLVI